MSNAIPDDHHTVTTDTGTTIGHTWPGTWARPYTPADGRDTAWLARSVHDDPADTFLHDFSTRPQAETFLRIRDTIARRADRDTDLLAHPEQRACGYREILVHLESDLDQPIPALFTYATGPRFTPDNAEIVVALLNRAYLADHERPLAYREGSTITVVYPACYADDPTYQPERYDLGDDGRYGLGSDWAWHPVNDDEQSPTEEQMTARRRRAHQFLATRRRRR